MIRERVLKIGKPQPLVAIASMPEKIDTEKPAVIIVNSGVMHHIGTCRMSVKFARALAGNGHLTLRFDFSGIGDSTPRSGTLSYTESACLEIKEVMDYLQRTKGIGSFIILGLCSGADAAFETALAEPRVKGICQIDPYCYRTRKWYLHHYLPRLVDPNHWKLFIQHRRGKYRMSIDGDVYDENFEIPSYVREFPPQSAVKQGLATLFENGVDVLSIFTSDSPINHDAQFENSMRGIDFKARLTTKFYRGCSHILKEPEFQETAVYDICTWMDDVCAQYGGETQAAA